MTGRQDWRTPPALFQLLTNEFHFTMDGAASEADALCKNFLSGPHREGGCDCALCFHIGCPAYFLDERIFVNPPYADLLPWVKVFAEWRDLEATVVALLPAKSDTEWFSAVVNSANEIRLMSRRVQFIDPDTGKPGANSNNGGSMIAIWRPGPRPPQAFAWLWDWRG